MNQGMGKRAKDKKSTENKKDCNANIEAVNVGTNGICVCNGVARQKRGVVYDNQDCRDTSE
jgi:hypothetical protein